MIQIILFLSILLQLIALGVAVRLFFITRKFFAWFFISSAILFMAVRRIITFMAILEGAFVPKSSLWAEIVALVISGLLTLGMYFLIPVFKSIFNNREKLQSANEALILANQKIRSSEQRLTQIMNNMGESFTITDLDENFLYANPAACKVFGVENGALIGENLNQFVSKVDFLKIRKQTNLRETGVSSTYYHDIITKNGQKKTIVITGVPDYDDKNNIVGTIGTFRDITELLEIEKALTESESNLNALINNQEESIWSIDSNYNYLKFNDFFAMAYKKSYGVELKKGMNAIDILSDDLREFWKAKYDCALRGENKKFEFIYEGKRGKRYYEVNLNPVRNNDKIIGCVAISIEITERKKIEFALKISNKSLKLANKTKDKFFSIIAHDLRSPFSGILGLTKILFERHKTMDEQKREDIIRNIYTSTSEVYSLVNSLLEWSRLQSDKIILNLQVYSLETIFEEALNQTKNSAENKEISLETSFFEDWKLNCDLQMISTVIRNLISNAIKFTPRGGSIMLSAEKKLSDIIISVEDNGVGMDEDLKNKLFDISQKATTLGTEKEKGSGLGLLLCKEFVEKHGGQLWVESKVGEGTSFSFSIPEIKTSALES